MKNTNWRAGFVVALLSGLAGFAQSAPAEDLGAAIEKGMGEANNLIQIYESWQEFSAAHSALTPGDSQFEPDYSPPGSPQIPSAYAESTKCQACYEKVVKDINFYRFSLDKGRGIANGTLQYAKKALAFGDTGSASFGVGGLAWSYKAKPQIEKAVSKLRKTYQSKYEEWIAGLERSL